MNMMCFKSEKNNNVFEKIYIVMDANNWEIQENRKNIIDKPFCIPHKIEQQSRSPRDLTNYLKNSIKDENTMTICYYHTEVHPDVISNDNIYAIATVKYINDAEIEITCLCTNNNLVKVNAGRFCLTNFFKILDSTRLYIKVVLETIKSINSVVSTMYEKFFNMTKIVDSKHTHFLQFPRDPNTIRGRGRSQYISRGRDRDRSQSQYISQSRGQSRGQSRSQSRGRSQRRDRSRSRDRYSSGGGKRTKRNNKKYH